MQLRRPELSDKAAVIDMMKEFEASQSAHDGGFGLWITLFMRTGLKEIN